MKATVLTVFGGFGGGEAQLIDKMKMKDSKQTALRLTDFFMVVASGERDVSGEQQNSPRMEHRCGRASRQSLRLIPQTGCEIKILLSRHQVTAAQ